MTARHAAATEASTTQGKHPLRATVRTVFAAFVALAALAPTMYAAATNADPAAATGAAGVALALAGAITRVMALPGVEAFLKDYLPFLAAEPKA